MQLNVYTLYLAEASRTNVPVLYRRHKYCFCNPRRIPESTERAHINPSLPRATECVPRTVSQRQRRERGLSIAEWFTIRSRTLDRDISHSDRRRGAEGEGEGLKDWPGKEVWLTLISGVWPI